MSAWNRRISEYRGVHFRWISHRQVGLDLVWGAGGKPTGAKFRSGGIRAKSDLEARVHNVLYGVVFEGNIPPCLQEATREVLERAQSFTARFSEQTAVVEQLSNDVGDLQ